MKQVTITLTDEQYDRLQRLAETRTKDSHKHHRAPRTFTPEDCLVSFVEHCQPGGSGWVSP